MPIDREDAMEWLQDSIRRLHQNGFLVTGRIELLDFRKCPTCEAATVWDGTEHICPICAAPVRLLVPIKAGPTQRKLEQLVVSMGLKPEADVSGLLHQIENALVEKIRARVPVALPRPTMNTDAPFCSNCGDMMIRSGTCYTCLECGTTSGCS